MLGVFNPKKTGGALLKVINILPILSSTCVTSQCQHSNCPVAGPCPATICAQIKHGDESCRCARSSCKPCNFSLRICETAVDHAAWVSAHHPHMRTHMHIHTYIHTYIHIYTHCCVCAQSNEAGQRMLKQQVACKAEEIRAMDALFASLEKENRAIAQVIQQCSMPCSHASFGHHII